MSDSSGRTVPATALIVLGCPEVPVQQALALYIVNRLKKQGIRTRLAGNPAVLNLLKVSDPEQQYIQETQVLEKAIGEIAEKNQNWDLCIAFAHSDAGISYAATMRHLLPASRFVVILFGKDPEALAGTADLGCETIVEKAVHNPMQIRRKINEVFGWVV